MIATSFKLSREHFDSYSELKYALSPYKRFLKHFHAIEIVSNPRAPGPFSLVNC